MNFETFQKKNIDRCDTVAQSCKSTLKELEGILNQQNILVDTITNIYGQNTKILTRIINEVKESLVGIEAIANSLRSVEFINPAYKEEYDKLYEKIAALMSTLNGSVPPRFEGASESIDSEDSVPEEIISEESDTAPEEPIPTFVEPEEPASIEDISGEYTDNADDFSDADIDAMFTIEEDNTPVQPVSSNTAISSETDYKNNDERPTEASDKLKALFSRANKLNF